jgi:hypothetical protein
MTSASSSGPAGIEEPPLGFVRTLTANPLDDDVSDGDASVTGAVVGVPVSEGNAVLVTAGDVRDRLAERDALALAAALDAAAAELAAALDADADLVTVRLVTVELARGTGVEDNTVNVPSTRDWPVVSFAVTVDNPGNAPNVTEQPPDPNTSSVQSGHPPPVTVTVASHIPWLESTETLAETSSPTCAGFGPPMPPVSAQRGGGAAPAAVPAANELSPTVTSTTPSTDERSSAALDTQTWLHAGAAKARQSARFPAAGGQALPEVYTDCIISIARAVSSSAPET